MNQLINSVSSYLKKEFGEKTVKLAIDGGFTCPNRDGSKGTGGCLFCSEGGGGDFASTIEDQINLLSEKWPKAKYIAYFQNHTNTYAPVDVLREKYYEALNNPLISGIAIATRPDCINEEVLDLLSEINENHFMWVELGLQTIHEDTAELINRCYDLSVFDKAIQALCQRGIKVVVHLILGLPGESKADMIESVKYVCNSGAWGLKLHLLNVVRGSRMEKDYSDYNSFPSIDDYVSFICDLLEIIPPEIVMHRLTGDAPRNILITPEWSYRKRTILNGINSELHLRGSYQGCKAEK
ncbi:MAG: TIGR01212 family radical SAM protein [Clostridia bacterium]|nr:TIGR01212 family radical SAM protein [Clostridia bacterium]